MKKSTKRILIGLALFILFLVWTFEWNPKRYYQVVAEHKAKYSVLQIGMTRDSVQKLFGPPDDTFGRFKNEYIDYKMHWFYEGSTIIQFDSTDHIRDVYFRDS